MMDERVKRIRSEAGLKQDEFAKRLGVKREQISRIESGSRQLTDQMVLAICREYGINEDWLRYEKGGMRVTSASDLIKKYAAENNLDELDCKIIEIYAGLPDAHKQAFKSFAIKLGGIANEIAKDAEFARELSQAEELDAEYRRMEFGRMLTEEEAIGLVRQRYADAKKGEPSTSTSENYATG